MSDSSLKKSINNKTKILRNMKIEYLVPEMEVLEIKYWKILCASDADEPGYGGEGDPEDNEPD